VRSIPYVSITADDGRQRHYETNAISAAVQPRLLRLAHVSPADRTASCRSREVLTTSQPAEQVIAGPETEVSTDKTQATTRMFETVQDGVLQRSWCIIPGDPPWHLHLRHLDRWRAARPSFVFLAPSRCRTRIPTTDPARPLLP